MPVSRRRRLPTVSALIATACLGVACGGPPPEPTSFTTEVDRRRAAALASEPLLAEAITEPMLAPGIVHSELLGWTRTEVAAELYGSAGGLDTDPAPIEEQLTAAAKTLRDGGWRLHWQMCLPPPGPLVVERTLPMGIPRHYGYEWLISGYKISDGISLWALVIGLATEGQTSVSVLLRAPNSRDPDNVIGIGPRGLREGEGCAEDGLASVDVESAGTPMEVRAWWPFPGEPRTADPLLR